MSYDAFNNLTGRGTQVWSLSSNSFSASYTNNRKTSGGATVTYDAAGNTLSSNQGSPNIDSIDWEFDAAGRQRRWEEFGPYGATTEKGEEITFDGDGRAVKRTALFRTKTGGTWGSWTSYNAYNIYSSVTGQKISDIANDGALEKHHIYLGGTAIVEQAPGNVDKIRATDPIVGSTRDVDPDGAIFAGDEESTRNEAGAMGMSIPHSEPSTMPEPTYSRGGNLGNSEAGCQLNGAPVNCDEMRPILKSLGFFRGTNHLIKQTWKEKRFYTAVGEAVEQGEEDFGKRNGGYVGSVWELTRTEVINLPGGGQIGQTNELAPLNKKERKNFEKSREKSRKALAKDKCGNFLREKLGANVIDAVLNTLNTHQAFSGPRSTAIDVVTAGIVSADEALRLRKLSTGTDQAASAAEYELTRSVAQYFKDTDGANRSTVHAAVGNYQGNPNTAFYRSFNSVRLLHETLHIVTGKNDNDLAVALGIDIKPFDGDYKLASSAITDALKANGCK